MEDYRFKKGKHFEEKIVQALITDHQFAEQMMEVLDVEYFNIEHLKEVVDQIFNYYKKYVAFPSFKTLALIIKDEVANKTLQAQIVQYLLKIKDDPLNGDADYIKDESLDFCRKRSLALALEKSLDHIEQKTYGEIVPEIQKALVAGSERDIGHVYMDDDSFERRMTKIARNPVPTPWPEINEITQGGAGPGELWTLAAPTGVGKSHFLVDWGHYAAMLGYNVAHYTLELSDENVGRRYDSRYSLIPVQELFEHKEHVRKSLEDVKGHLVIKSYPTKAATVLTLKSHIHKLTMKDMKPDIIFVDMGELLRSSKSYDHKRFEEERIFEDLRGLGGHLQIPVATVTQTNRSGLSAEVITLEYIAECIQKAFISDVFLTMQRIKSNAVENSGNMFIAKNRLGPDGIKLNMMMNTAISRIRIIGEEDVDEIADPEDRLKKRFAEFTNKDKGTE